MAFVTYIARSMISIDRYRTRCIGERRNAAILCRRRGLIYKTASINPVRLSFHLLAGLNGESCYRRA